MWYVKDFDTLCTLANYFGFILTMWYVKAQASFTIR